ncbi:MAG TPA: hypothetical protein VL171_12455 [Verrucomicrobiae bacterium]|nr:hypothetical protein [Verrucomicrobiae bacterium]
MHDFFQMLRQPEYVHVLLNPIPVYGTLCGLVALIVALILRSRPAHIVAYVIVILSTLSVWPVTEYGERAYDRVYSMSNRDAQEWLDVHMHRADRGVYVFYATALVAAVALVLRQLRPRTQSALAVATLVLVLASLFTGGWISRAGGKIRHSEFRTGPPPHPVLHEDD